MKKILSVFIIIVAIAACSKKTLPTIERRTEEPPAPVVEINLAAGEKLYTTRCIRCHELYKPSKYTAQRWETILTTMIPRAGLSGADAANVRAYVNANSAAN